MTWRNYIEEVLDMLIDKAEMLSKEAGDATLERHNTSFIALKTYWQYQ